MFASSYKRGVYGSWNKRFLEQDLAGPLRRGPPIEES